MVEGSKLRSLEGENKKSSKLKGGKIEVEKMRRLEGENR